MKRRKCRAETRTKSIVAVVVCAAVLMMTLVVLVPRAGASTPSRGSFLLEGPPFLALTPNLTLTSPHPQTDGYFGSSAAISSTTVVVGAYGEKASGYAQAGHVYLFGAMSGKLVHRLTSPNAQSGGNFGFAVAISGTTVVVGAPNEAASNYSGAGHAYVFNASTGKLIRTLTSPHAQYGGCFGYSVAITGSTLVIGAMCETADTACCGNYSAGHVYAFDATSGKLTLTLTSPNAQPDGAFGSSVAVSGTRLMVGAPGEGPSPPVQYPPGAAYLFEAKTGALIANLTDPQPAGSGRFGSSVAIDSTTAVVGAGGETASGVQYAGLTYLYNATTGNLTRTLAPPKPTYTGGFGQSVAISGTKVFVGNGSYIYVFKATTGKRVLTLTMGGVVSVMGTTVMIGAAGETVSGSKDAGQAYIFKGV